MGDNIHYQVRGNVMSNRELLANALETSAKNSEELSDLRQFKEIYYKLLNKNQELFDVQKQINDISLNEGTDNSQLAKLKNQQKLLKAKIRQLDNSLLKLESKNSIQSILNIEKKRTVQKTLEKYSETSKQTRDEQLAELRKQRDKYISERKKVEKTKKQTKNNDSISTEHNNKPLFTDTTDNADINENKSPKITENLFTTEHKKIKKKKIRYCKLCGGLIDPETKKCSKCNKQYFKIRIKKPSILTIVISVLLVISVIVNVYTFQRISKLNHYNISITETLDSKQNLLDEQTRLVLKLRNKIDSLESDLKFHYNDCAIVYDNGTNLYHSDREILCKLKKYKYSYNIYNIKLVKSLGYKPCPDCH